MEVEQHCYSTIDRCPTPGCSGEATFDWLELRSGSTVLKRRLMGVVCNEDCFEKDLEAASRAAEGYGRIRSIG